MPKKIVSEMMDSLIRNKLYSEADENTGTEVTGHKTFIVKTMCTTPEADEPIPQTFTVQATSPEEAKKRAMDMAKEAGKLSCKISGVDMVANSDEELNNYGSGSALNVNPDDTKGQVMPSDASNVPDGDAKA